STGRSRFWSAPLLQHLRQEALREIEPLRQLAHLRLEPLQPVVEIRHAPREPRASLALAHLPADDAPPVTVAKIACGEDHHVVEPPEPAPAEGEAHAHRTLWPAGVEAVQTERPSHHGEPQRHAARTLRGARRRAPLAG